MLQTDPLCREITSRDVLDTLPYAIYVIDNDHNVHFINKRAASLAWTVSESAIGLKCADVFKCSHGQGCCPVFPTALDCSSETHGVTSFLLPDGGQREGKLVVTHIGGYHVVTIEDCTTERMTSEFVAVAAHELRTPMTSIKAYVSLLMSGRFGEVDAPKVQALSIVDRNVDRLVRFTTDILTLSRIESGKMRLSKVQVNIDAFLNIVLRKYDTRLQREDVSLRITVENGVTALADPDRLEQVIDNLLDNAIKFAPKGSSVDLSVATEEHGCHFSISNTGDPIPEDKLPRIFDKFYQCNGVDSAIHAGRGLGLAICKGLVSLMDGKIWAVNHSERQGVTFHFLLPV